MNVVLPAPFGPSNPNTLPSRIARSTPASARVLPKLFMRPMVSIAFVMEHRLEGRSDSTNTRGDECQGDKTIPTAAPKLTASCQVGSDPMAAARAGHPGFARVARWIARSRADRHFGCYWHTWCSVVVARWRL